MVISIIGWYGTETLGDRAILDGILCVLNRIEPHCKLNLGSLYPFYSRRTLWEEKDIFKMSAPTIPISIFDLKEDKERVQKLKESDLVIIGGGPLMGLEELYLLKKCTKTAKKYDIPVVVMGCGVGPFKEERHIMMVKKILEDATFISFRDSVSYELAKQIMEERFHAEVLGDPAVISIEHYLKCHVQSRKEYVAVNLREYPQSEYGASSCFDAHDLTNMIRMLKDLYGEVLLVPMHSFGIGGDDRYYLASLMNMSDCESVKVLHSPMNLYELYAVYQNALGCIGMRYHSIVMQTILNGNNLILDYTHKKNGKINGFLAQIDKEGFYSPRRINLQTGSDISLNDFIEIIGEKNCFQYAWSDMESNYAILLKEVLYES